MLKMLKKFASFPCTPSSSYSWILHDVTKIKTTKLLIFPRLYFYDVKEQLKTTAHTNFRSEWVLGFAIDYA